MLREPSKRTSSFCFESRGYRCDGLGDSMRWNLPLISDVILYLLEALACLRIVCRVAGKCNSPAPAWAYVANFGSIYLSFISRQNYIQRRVCREPLKMVLEFHGSQVIFVVFISAMLCLTLKCLSLWGKGKKNTELRLLYLLSKILPFFI